jgi:hypothetical protein
VGRADDAPCEEEVVDVLAEVATVGDGVDALRVPLRAAGQLIAYELPMVLGSILKTLMMGRDGLKAA